MGLNNLKVLETDQADQSSAKRLWETWIRSADYKESQRIQQTAIDFLVEIGTREALAEAEENGKNEARLFDIVNKSEWLTTKEAAAFLRIKVGTLRNWTSDGKIPPAAYRKTAPRGRKGGRNLYLKSALEELLLAGTLEGVSHGS